MVEEEEEVVVEDFKEQTMAYVKKLPEEKKEMGVPSKRSVAMQALKLAPLALKVWAELLDDKNSNIRLGAANRILDKAIPDLRSTELKNEEGKSFTFREILAKEFPDEPKSSN